VKSRFHKKLKSAQKWLGRSHRKLATGEEQWEIIKDIRIAFNKTVEAWILKNGYELDESSGRDTVDAQLETLAPRELGRKVSLLRHKLWHLYYGDSYSPKLNDGGGLTSKQWELETRICLDEVVAIAEHIKTGSSLQKFKGETQRKYQPGQRVKYYSHIQYQTEETPTNVWCNREGKVLSVQNDMVNIRWGDRTIDSICEDALFLEPMDGPIEKMDSPFLRRRNWFDLHPEHRQNPLFVDNAGNFNHSAFYTCQCCGYPVMNIHPINSHPDYDLEPEAYEICLLCDWADECHDVWGGVDETGENGNFDYSLIEARNNFEKYSCMFRPDHDPFFKLNTIPRVAELKQRLRSCFDDMIGETNQWKAYLLWHRASKTRQALQRTLRVEERKYSEYGRLSLDEEGFPVGRDFSNKWKWGGSYYRLGQWHKDYAHDKSKIIWFGSGYYGNSLMTRIGTMKGKEIINSIGGGITNHVSWVAEYINHPRDDETTPRALRRNWFDLHPEHSREKPTCPCCGFPTLHEVAKSETCFICGWVDTGQDDYEASEVLGGANGNYSLFVARGNFEKYFCMFSPDDPSGFAHRHLKAECIRKKETIQTLFYKMLESGDRDSVDKYWREIHKIKEELGRD